MKRVLSIVLLIFLAASCSRGSAPAPAHEGHETPPASSGSMPGMPGMESSHGGQEPEGAQESAGGVPLPEGYAEVLISPDRQQLIGLKLAKVERGELSGTVRASAVIAADETKEAHIHSKLMGWVQELFVNAVGQKVEKGEPLYSLYSQDLYTTEQEYLNALKTNPALAQSARKRLLLWDVPEDEIRKIERSGPIKNVVFRSPIRGTVIEKSVLQGHYIESGMMLYHIADLSQVWVLADVYEFEVNRIDRKGAAKIQVQGLDEPLTARIDYFYPTVEPSTRTVKVRLILPNVDGLLRPGNYATVELPTEAADVLWVPSEAVIDTGVRQVAYVSLGEGRFRPVEIKLGRRAGERFEVREGLSEGMEVVVGAQFLLDSESRLRGVSGPNAAHKGAH